MASLLEDLDNSDPMFVIPRDDVIDTVLNPAFKAATSVDCMMGYFTSHSLAEIAPGLAIYLTKSKNPLRLVISPFITAADYEAIQSGFRSADEFAETSFEDDLPNANALVQHTLRCFAWLIREGRLELKFALIKDALFHIKAWMFKDETDCAALHGSSNMT